MTRILIAEDDTVIQTLLQRMLESQNYHVDCVNNGFSALQMLKEHDYEVALLDIRMPGMDGIRVAEEYLNGVKPRRAAVIALTADATPATLQRCRFSGFDMCLFKPIRRQALLDAVLSFVDNAPTSAHLDADEDIENALTDSTNMIDISKLHEIDTLGIGDANDYLTRFLESASQIQYEMHNACLAGEYQRVLDLAHRLEGSAGSVGATLLSNSCMPLRQTKLDAVDPIEVMRQISHISSSIKQTNSALYRIISALRSTPK